MYLNKNSLFIVFFFIVAACGQGQEAKPKYVTSADETSYVSDYFGLRITKPNGWYALDEPGAKQIMNIGSDVIAGDDENLQRTIDASVQQTTAVFAFFQHPPGAVVEMNANLLAVAESVKWAPGIKTGEDYFFHVKALMAQSGMDVSFEEGYSEKLIGGETFTRMDGSISIMGQTVNQSYFAARRGDYIIGFTGSYGNDGQLAAIEQALDTVTFK